MSLSEFSATCEIGEADKYAKSAAIVGHAKEASRFLKAISHESRLLILCMLGMGEKSVTELENLLSIRQATISQQLARLRYDGLVQTRREGRAIYYSLASERTYLFMNGLYDMFCGEDLDR